jgi:hypothetical protein
MHSEVNRFMKDKYTVKSPISKDRAKTLVTKNLDGTVMKPPVAKYTKNLDNGYRSVIGMLLWVQRNTKIDISTSLGCLAYLCRAMASPSDIAFECLLQTVQWVYQECHTELKFTSDNSIVPYA